MRNHTTPSFYELISQQGKNPSITPGAAPVAVQFLMNNLPTGKDGRLWYYCTAIVVKLTVRIHQLSTGDAAITADQLWQIVQSVNVQCPILGQLFTHQNTRGSVLGNLIQYAGFGFNRAPVSTALAVNESPTDYDRTLYFRIPFAYEFLCKPHETSPWNGFFEGGTVEVKIDSNTVLGSVSAGATITTPCNLRCWMEYIPSPETVIHTPCHWREHQTPGNSTKMIIQDMGSPDGLQGIDQSKGVGIAHLLYLMNPEGLGLLGSTTADNIISYDIPWRDQQRVDIPDAPFLAKMAHMGNNRLAPGVAAAVDFGNGGQGGDPYAFAGNPQGDLNDESAMYFPLVASGRDLETSKLQTVAGAKESNYTFGSDGTPSGINRFIGQYFPVFDEQFMQALAARIAPNKAGDLVAKTLNKQKGGVHGIGKLAYVRAKVT